MTKHKKCDLDNKLSGASVDEARRDLLRLGMAALPLLSASLILPTPLMAATRLSDTLVRPKVPRKGPVPSAKPPKPRLLMIDPGHGGRDPGAIGLSGTKEKDITLDIAKRMARAIGQQQGVEAKLTRNRDESIPLGTRVEMGQEARADMFISIHADSAPNKRARGLSAYTLSKKASDQFANQLATRENQADLIGGLNMPVEDEQVAEILFDLTARHTRNTAQRVKVGFIKAMGRQWTLLPQPMRSANFAVLRSPDVPSLLVETGFLSNKKDESILTKPAKRERIAQLMAKEVAFLMRSSLFG